MADVDRLQEDIQRLVVPGGRLPGAEGHAAARAHIVQRLDELALSPYRDGSFELPYSEGGQNYVNVLARIPGRTDQAAPVLVAAHYDTCGPYPGADDNAAAVAILLSVAERLCETPAERSIVCAFFDAEEPPTYQTSAMGSIHFYHQQQTEPVHCALVLDLCGHDLAVLGFEDLLFVTGMESDPAFEQTIQACSKVEGIRAVPTLNRYIGDLSDHHIFRINRRPYLFLSCGRWEHYHQPTDTIDRLSFPKIAAVAGYLEALIRDTAQRTFEGPFEGYDTVPTELQFIQKAAGPFLSLLGFNPQTREDLDMMVQALINQFGL